MILPHGGVPSARHGEPDNHGDPRDTFYSWKSRDSCSSCMCGLELLNVSCDGGLRWDGRVEEGGRGEVTSTAARPCQRGLSLDSPLRGKGEKKRLNNLQLPGDAKPRLLVHSRVIISSKSQSLPIRAAGGKRRTRAGEERKTFGEFIGVGRTAGGKKK